jgi:hypothetical protein
MECAKNFKKQVGTVHEKLLGLDNLSSQCGPAFKSFIRNKDNVFVNLHSEDCTDLCDKTDADAHSVRVNLSSFVTCRFYFKALGRTIKDRMKSEVLGKFRETDRTLG